MFFRVGPKARFVSRRRARSEGSPGMADGRRRALALGEVRRTSRAMRLGRSPGTGFSWPRAQRGVARSAQARQSTKRMLTPPLRNGTDQRCVIGGGFLHFYGMVVDWNFCWLEKNVVSDGERWKKSGMPRLSGEGSEGP